MITLFIILFVIIIFCSLFSSSDNKNHVTQDGVKWIHINNVNITNPLAKKAFEWYKDMVLNKQIGIHQLGPDEQLLAKQKEMLNITNSLPDDNESTFVDALSTRFFLIGSNGIKPDWLIMNPKEECLFHTKLSALDTVQRIARNVSYSGIRSVGNGLRVGAGTLYTKDVEGLTRFDAGDVVVTNQRIIFKGTKKSKTIKISNIISIDNFDDNGVIITMDNRVNPVVIRFLADKCFYYNEDVDMRVFYDDLNDFYRSISKALSSR